jgi:tripartite-type tricarboxylate transporter receptor subunit TctC
MDHVERRSTLGTHIMRVCPFLLGCFVPGLACRLVRMVLAGLAIWAATAAQAEQYPAHPIRIIVPFASGGPADIYARFIAQRFQDALSQPVVVDDRPGAGSMIGTDAVAKAAPDGYTLLLMSNTHTVNETLMPAKPYSLLRDFAPIAPINYSDLVLVVNPAVPAKSLQELLKLARAQPGKLTYASSGPGTPYHMAGELFKAMAGVDILHVPYRGSSAARADVLGGQVDMMFDAVTTMAEHAKAGKVRALGTSGRTRSMVLPDIPTIAEAGVPDYEAVIWLGLMAPRGTPAAIVTRLNAELQKITRRDDVRADWGRQGATPMVMGADEFERFIAGDITKWARIVKISGAKPEQ